MNRCETWSLKLTEEIYEKDKKAFKNRMIRVYEAAENCITGIITICRLHKTIL
jgi:hypothetical protein